MKKHFIDKLDGWLISNGWEVEYDVWYDEKRNCYSTNILIKLSARYGMSIESLG